MARTKDKGELFTCKICSDEVRRDKSYQYEDGRACRKHPEAQIAHTTIPQPALLRKHQPEHASEVSAPKRANGRVAIIEKLRGKPNGTKVRIIFAAGGEDAFAAVAYLVMMVDKIITMDTRSFIDLYAVGISKRWERVSRTCEVTLDFNEESDLDDWFAPRLERGLMSLAVI